MPSVTDSIRAVVEVSRNAGELLKVSVPAEEGDHAAVDRFCRVTIGGGRRSMLAMSWT